MRGVPAARVLRLHVLREGPVRPALQREDGAVRVVRGGTPRRAPAVVTSQQVRQRAGISGRNLGDWGGGSDTLIWNEPDAVAWSPPALQVRRGQGIAGRLSLSSSRTLVWG